MIDLILEDSAETRYAFASGASFQSAAFLGYRFHQDWGRYRPEISEAWVMATSERTDGAAHTQLGYPSTRWYTGIWQSPTRRVFVVDSDGLVHINSGFTEARSFTAWEQQELDVPLDGVWGLDDQFVLVWGGNNQGRFPLFRFDGSNFERMHDPGFDIRAIHGSRRDSLCAVGVGGAIAHWNGNKWSRVAGPVGETLTSVWAESDDEFYATGAHGALLEGSSFGWKKVAQREGPEEWPLHCVAKWRGELWIAGGPFGLLRRKGITHELEVVSTDFLPTWIDARESLVMTCRDVIVGSEDGKVFHEASVGTLRDARRFHRLCSFAHN